MAPPIYFLPKTTLADVAKDGELLLPSLAAWGLDTIFADCRTVPGDAILAAISTAAGPSGESGCLLMAKGEGDLHPRAGMYVSEFQEWQDFSVLVGKPLWVGVDKESPITSEDLAKSTRFRGYPLELPSGIWQIPVIRNPEGGTGLPTDWELQADGEVETTVQAAYCQLWKEFAGVVDLYFSPDDPSPAGTFVLDRKEAMRRCLQVLGINYRFGRVEQNLLRVIGSETWHQILGYAVDLPGFWDVYEQTQAQKKIRDEANNDQESRPESPDISPGPPDGSPATGPAVES